MINYRGCNTFGIQETFSNKTKTHNCRINFENNENF